MCIGGTARYFAELTTKQEVEEAVRFSTEHKLSFLVLGSGSNMIFADDVNAFVVQVKYGNVTVEGGLVTVGAGKNIALLLNELAAQGIDLSLLTGIPGTVGGAIFGNAGQGPKGIWIDSFVESVTAFSAASWKTFTREECQFGYRDSFFKNSAQNSKLKAHSSPVIWEATLKIPQADSKAIKGHIEDLLKRRIAAQPHRRTAGSCFKAVGGTPAWQLIETAGLRGYKVGGIEISPKHANFLINTGEGTYVDAVKIVDEVKKKVPENLEVEMRFIEPDGSVRFL